MAYTIIKSDGSTLTTIQDGTINTTSTSLGLPGRNYAGYGQILNTNFVRVIENFANDTYPSNPIKGQLWYDTTVNSVKVFNGGDPATQNNWVTLVSTASGSGGTTSLGNVNATGNITAGNISATGIIGDTITVRLANVTDTLTVTNTASITSGVIPSITSQTITTGGQTTSGTFTGDWTVIGNNASGGNSFNISAGNISFPASSTHGVKCDNYMNADGTPFTPAGTYNDANVSAYLTGKWANGASYAGTGGLGQFNGNIKVGKIEANNIAGGGNIAGIWTLDSGARFQATYADLAERFEADAEYDPGTVVELGGTKEVTAVKDDLSEFVFGVVSNTAAMLMNGAAGNDKTHPPVAVSGRVHVKVRGKVKKGDRLVSAGEGIARSAQPGEVTAFNTIGRSLENKNDEDLGKVEAIVIIR